MICTAILLVARPRLPIRVLGSQRKCKTAPPSTSPEAGVCVSLWPGTFFIVSPISTSYIFLIFLFRLSLGWSWYLIIKITPTLVFPRYYGYLSIFACFDTAVLFFWSPRCCYLTSLPTILISTPSSGWMTTCLGGRRRFLLYPTTRTFSTMCARSSCIWSSRSCTTTAATTVRTPRLKTYIYIYYIFL